MIGLLGLWLALHRQSASGQPAAAGGGTAADAATAQSLGNLETDMLAAIQASNTAIVAALGQPPAAAIVPPAATPPATPPSINSSLINQVGSVLFGAGNTWSALDPATQLAEWTQTLQTLDPALKDTSQGVFTTAFNWLNGAGQKYVNPYATGALVNGSQAALNAATVINSILAGSGIPDVSTLLQNPPSSFTGTPVAPASAPVTPPTTPPITNTVIPMPKMTF